MSKQEYRSSDKGKWFTDDGHTTFIRCTTDRLVDCLTDIFKGDRNRARKVNSCFRPVTLNEYAKNKLYEI